MGFDHDGRIEGRQVEIRGGVDGVRIGLAVLSPDKCDAGC